MVKCTVLSYIPWSPGAFTLNVIFMLMWLSVAGNQLTEEIKLSLPKNVIEGSASGLLSVLGKLIKLSINSINILEILNVLKKLCGAVRPAEHHKLSLRGVLTH